MFVDSWLETAESFCSGFPGIHVNPWMYIDKVYTIYKSPYRSFQCESCRAVVEEVFQQKDAVEKGIMVTSKIGKLIKMKALKCKPSA